MTAIYKDVTESPWSAATSDSPSTLHGKLQTAIDDCSADGSILLIPTGTWIINQALLWNTGSKIHGVGIDKTIIKIDNGNTDPDEAVLRPSANDSTIINWHIQDMTLDGNYSRISPVDTGDERPGGSCLSTNGASYGHILRVKAKNACLHCFDICNGGEIDGGVSYYVDPDNEDPTYYPANESQHVTLTDCVAENSGDDLFTTHYSKNIWLINCHAKTGSTRHVSDSGQGTSTGIEIDDGSRQIFIENALIEDVLYGIYIKCHDNNPASQNVIINGARIEQCNDAISIIDPYDAAAPSPTALNVVISDVIIRAPTHHTNADVYKAIVVNAYQHVKISNVIIEGAGVDANAGIAISIGDYAKDVEISNVSITDWNTSESSTSIPVINISSSCTDVSIDNVTSQNSGGVRGLIYTGSNPIKLRNIRFSGPSTASSIGFRLSTHPSDSKSNVYGNKATGFTNPTSFDTSVTTAEAEQYICNLNIDSILEYEAVKIIAAMTTRPTRVRRMIINDLIVALKKAGVWAKLDSLYLTAATDSQAGYLDWKTPGSNSLTASGAVTFTANQGVAANGTTSYLTASTNLNALPTLTQDNAHIGVWVRSGATDNDPVVGSLANLTGDLMIVPCHTTVGFRGRVSADSIDTFAAGASPVGHWLINRSVSTGHDGYKNAVFQSTQTRASTGVGATPMAVGQSCSLFNANQVSAVHVGSSLTATEITALYTALQGYLSEVGAI